MSKQRIILVIVYMVAVLSAYLLKKVTYRIANKAIEEEKLSTGIYTFFPVEGKRAVELAKGYIRGVNIYFWFMVILFPLIYILFLINHAI